jgi:hypothetical protein
VYRIGLIRGTLAASLASVSDVLVRSARAVTAHVAVVAVLLAGACGNNGSPPGGGSEPSSLQVLVPPGESIGLPFHGVETLRVLYSDPAGQPVARASVSFQLVTSASEASGGSTVSATDITTNANGIAAVELVAGAERVNFRVQATADDAAPAVFYVAVSEEGFADLIAAPEHGGFRAADSFQSVELRLYRAGELACADLDIDAPPESVFPLRALEGFGETVTYRNVGAGEPYTLIGWGAMEPEGARLAAGCVELTAGHVRAGSAIRFPLQVIDRIPALPTELALDSSFDTTPLADAIAAAGPDVWPALDCPLGRAQLLIDCALDAEVPDGALDCQVGGAGDLVDDVEALRGAPGGGGCRPAGGPNGDSLDQLVEARLGPPWPEGAALAELLAARRAPLVSFRLSSRLEAGGSGSLGHRLERLSISSGAEVAELDLVASDRPVVRQVAPAVMDPVGGRLALGRHSFTIDYGRFAEEAFGLLGLAPAGLEAEARTLGSALYQSVATETQTGCAAFSTVVCTELGRAGGCLTAACAVAANQLDLLLDAWWQLLDGPGYDLALSGTALLRDTDADLVLDGLGAGDGVEDLGAWTGAIRLTDGESIELSGSFTGEPAETP